MRPSPVELRDDPAILVSGRTRQSGGSVHQQQEPRFAGERARVREFSFHRMTAIPQVDEPCPPAMPNVEKPHGVCHRAIFDANGGVRSSAAAKPTAPCMCRPATTFSGRPSSEYLKILKRSRNVEA